MAKNVKFHGISPKYLLDLSYIFLTGGILENKLKQIEANSCSVWGMTEELTSFEANPHEQETELEEPRLPEDNVQQPTKRCTNIVPHSTVEFLDLHDVYEKVQSRAGGGSAQRIAMGNVNITTTSEGQLCGIDVFVERLPGAAALFGDINGMIPLKVTHQSHFQNQQTFSVDLDSVYNGTDGTPIYRLATVDAERRNLFNLVVFLKFIDGARTRPFHSKPFLIRSRRPRSRTESSEM